MSDVELLLMDEVAALIRVPVNTLRYYRQRGGGPPSFRVGRRVLYRRADVLDWIDQQRRNSAANR